MIGQESSYDDGAARAVGRVVTVDGYAGANSRMSEVAAGSGFWHRGVGIIHHTASWTQHPQPRTSIKDWLVRGLFENQADSMPKIDRTRYQLPVHERAGNKRLRATESSCLPDILPPLHHRFASEPISMTRRSCQDHSASGHCSSRTTNVKPL